MHTKREELVKKKIRLLDKQIHKLRIKNESIIEESCLAISEGKKRKLMLSYMEISHEISATRRSLKSWKRFLVRHFGDVSVKG